jgi:hypothetical protein
MPVPIRKSRKTVSVAGGGEDSFAARQKASRAAKPVSFPSALGSRDAGDLSALSSLSSRRRLVTQLP